MLGIISRLRPVVVQLSSTRYKKTIDYSRVPVLREEDLEMTFVRGSGPGGQSVSKTSNCCVMRHLPTNIIVKCHIHRSVSIKSSPIHFNLLNPPQFIRQIRDQEYEGGPADPHHSAGQFVQQGTVRGEPVEGDGRGKVRETGSEEEKVTGDEGSMESGQRKECRGIKWKSVV